jgi:hypothetical protein
MNKRNLAEKNLSIARFRDFLVKVCWIFMPFVSILPFSDRGSNFIECKRNNQCPTCKRVSLLKFGPWDEVDNQ